MYVHTVHTKHSALVCRTFHITKAFLHGSICQLKHTTRKKFCVAKFFIRKIITTTFRANFSLACSKRNIETFIRKSRTMINSDRSMYNMTLRQKRDREKGKARATFQVGRPRGSVTLFRAYYTMHIHSRIHTYTCHVGY